MRARANSKPSMANHCRLRFVIAGGGTGGHVLPALAVIDVLRKQDRVADILWIGSEEGVESDAARNAGVSFIVIPTGKLRRYLSVTNVLDAFRVPRGIVAARRALRSYRPDVVFSTGGFVSVPTVIAARGIAPVLTHEQTAVLGLATRINARFADVLAISHDQARADASRIHRRVVLTGNPVRRELATGDRAHGRTRFGFDLEMPMVYVTGGARGASPINQRIAQLLPELLEDAQVLHQTGPASANADLATLAKLRDSLPDRLRQRYHPVEFVRDELPDVYAAADLVVGRAGAGTVAELAFAARPSILIPLPGAGGDEQSANARLLADVGAAVVLPQHEADPTRLLAEIRAVLDDRQRRSNMAEAARTVAWPDAAARLAEALVDLGSTRIARQVS